MISRQRRDTMTDAEISVLALEIMHDLRSLSTKTHFDSNDSFVFPYSDTTNNTNNFNEILSDIDHINNTQTSMQNRKYNIVSLQANDSLKDIPPLPDPLSPKYNISIDINSKTSTSSMNIPPPSHNANYHYSTHKKRAIKHQKLTVNIPQTQSDMDPISINSMSPKSSDPSASNLSITAYSPYAYNSSHFSNYSTSIPSVSISQSPNRSPVYSTKQFMNKMHSAPVHVPECIDVSSCLSPKRKKKSKAFSMQNVRTSQREYNGNGNGNGHKNSNLAVTTKYKKRKKKRKSKIKRNKTPKARQKMHKYKRDRKYRSDELAQIGNQYRTCTNHTTLIAKNPIRNTKSLMTEFNTNINRKFSKKKKSKKKIIRKYGSDALHNMALSQPNLSNVPNGIAMETLTHSNREYIVSPKEPLPFFVKRGADRNQQIEYKNNINSNHIDMQMEVHHDDTCSDYTLHTNHTNNLRSSPICKAKNIRFLYNSSSNSSNKMNINPSEITNFSIDDHDRDHMHQSVRIKKHKKRKKRRNKRLKEREQHMRSVTPMPRSTNAYGNQVMNRTRVQRKRSNSIVHSTTMNDEYMIEFEDGFIFVNENKL